MTGHLDDHARQGCNSIKRQLHSFTCLVACVGESYDPSLQVKDLEFLFGKYPIAAGAQIGIVIRLGQVRYDDQHVGRHQPTLDHGAGPVELVGLGDQVAAEVVLGGSFERDDVRIEIVSVA